jgi:hypothetical protein
MEIGFRGIEIDWDIVWLLIAISRGPDDVGARIDPKVMTQFREVGTVVPITEFEAKKEKSTTHLHPLDSRRNSFRL